MAWASLSGWVWRGNTSQQPSTMGIQTSTICSVANLPSPLLASIPVRESAGGFSV
jgi:hypothetical protein